MLRLYFCTIFLFSCQLWAQEESFPLVNAVNVIITNKGINQIGTHLPSIVKKNGINIDEFYVDQSHYELEEKLTEDFTENPEIKKLIINIKENFKRYFEGFELKPHALGITINNIVANVKWKELKFNILPIPKNSQFSKNDLFIMEIILEADEFKLMADKVLFMDKNNDFLGNIGVDQFSLFTSDNRLPLKLKVPIIFTRDENKIIDLRISNMESNLTKIFLNYTFATPLIFPKISLKINEREFKFKVDELEKYLDEQSGKLLTTLKETLQNNLNTTAKEYLVARIDNFLKSGLTEINPMLPPGSPDGVEVEPMLWGITLNKIDYLNGNLLLKLNGKVEDPTLRNGFENLAPRNQAKGSLSIPPNSILQPDLIFAFNIGFINRFIQAGFNRGNFSSFELDSGEKLKLVKAPLIFLDANGRSKMALTIEYKVTGLSVVAVKNPIQFSFELFVNFALNGEGVVQFISEDIDMKSISLSDSNFKWPFVKIGVQKVYNRLEEARKSMTNYKLAEEIPVPSSLLGISLKNLQTGIDKAGYFLIYTKYQFDQGAI